MKLWTTMLAALAVLAVAAPAAFTANAMIPRDEAGAQSVKRTQPVLTPVAARKLAKSQAATIKTLNARVKTLAAQNKALKAQSRTQVDTIAVLQRQIWDLTHPVSTIVSQPPPVDPDVDCREYMLCEPEQDCRIWGNNCHLLQPPVTVAPEASQDGLDSGASENSGSASGGSQSSASNSGSQAGQLGCATLADPADSSANPDSYDWSC